MTIKIVLQKSFACDTERKRKALAIIVATTIDRGQRPGLPRELNEVPGKLADDYQLDENNDWLLTFEDDVTIRLTHRYLDKRAMGALSNWLAYRLNAENQDDDSTFMLMAEAVAMLAAHVRYHYKVSVPVGDGAYQAQNNAVDALARALHYDETSRLGLHHQVLVRSEAVEQDQQNKLTLKEAMSIGRGYKLPVVSADKEIQAAFASAAATKIAFEASSQTT